jgi:hypothetical protein
MSLLLALIHVIDPPAPPETGPSGGVVSPKRKPKRGRYEVDSFTNFLPTQPIIVKKDDNDLLIILMMQGG